MIFKADFFLFARIDSKVLERSHSGKDQICHQVYLKSRSFVIEEDCPKSYLLESYGLNRSPLYLTQVPVIEPKARFRTSLFTGLNSQLNFKVSGRARQNRL